MTAHELAAILLAGPDIPVTASVYGHPASSIDSVTVSDCGVKWPDLTVVLS